MAIPIITLCRMPPESWCGYSLNRRSGSGMPTEPSNPMAVFFASLLDRPRVCLMVSVTCRPIRTTGLSDVIGSWKIIAISVDQSRERSLRWRFVSSRPSKITCPVVSRFRVGSSPMMDRAKTVFPDPDSPTSPSVRPFSSVNDTPSTALRRPRGVRKWVCRSMTSSSGRPDVSSPLFIARVSSVTPASRLTVQILASTYRAVGPARTASPPLLGRTLDDIPRS